MSRTNKGSHRAKSETQTSKRSAGSRILSALRALWSYVLAIISALGGAAVIATGAQWLYNTYTDSKANEAMITAIDKLKTGDETQRTTAIDTLTYITKDHPKRLAKVYPEVIAFFDQQLGRTDTAVACGSVLDRTRTAKALRASDVQSALKFLRSRRRPGLDTLPQLHQVDLSMLDLHGADLRRVVFDHVCLDQAILESAILDSARFQHSSLRRVRMASAHGAGVVFNNSRLDSAALNDAVLPGASFANARLSFASLVNAQLDGSDFSGAVLEWSRWRGAHLRQTAHWVEVDTTKIAGALFDGAQGMTENNLAFLARFGACVRPIEQREWDNRLLATAKRDTGCGLSKSRRHGSDQGRQ